MVFGRRLGTDILVDKQQITILVADSCEEIRNLLKSYINSSISKVNYVETDNGIDAVKLFINKKPDLLILDLFLPKADGIQSCEAILRNNPKAKIVLMATQKNLQYIQARKHGARNVIHKPLDRVVVNNIISLVLSESW